MNLLHSAITALFMLSAISCNHNSNNQPDVANEELKTISADTSVVPSGLLNFDKQKDQQPNEKNQGSAANIAWDKKIIKTGTLNIEVEQYRKYSDNIHQLVTKWEGYIAKEEETSSDYKIENTLIIKVPVGYFDEAMQELSAQKGKLLVKQISSQDVTGEFTDTRARMEARKRIRLRYLDMLQKAKNMEEVLQIERDQFHTGTGGSGGRKSELSQPCCCVQYNRTYFFRSDQFQCN